MTVERLISVPEICNRLGIRQTKAFAMLKDGTLPRVKVGASTRVKESDLARYIESLKPDNQRVA